MFRLLSGVVWVVAVIYARQIDRDLSSSAEQTLASFLLANYNPRELRPAKDLREDKTDPDIRFGTLLGSKTLLNRDGYLAHLQLNPFEFNFTERTGDIIRKEVGVFDEDITLMASFEKNYGVSDTEKEVLMKEIAKFWGIKISQEECEEIDTLYDCVIKLEPKFKEVYEHFLDEVIPLQPPKRKPKKEPSDEDAPAPAVHVIGEDGKIKSPKD
mmetsp:Transcript_96819/g.153305  ORF Transcript_96819/g.153305 Transcript_96819/m.153305 type:complete len:213 (+) Transcript_96819:41-679(+)